VRPYIRSELPGWGKLARLLRVAGNENDKYWPKGWFAETVGKRHGYVMRLDLGDWSERISYFLGRYYDLCTQHIMSKYLKEGDRVLDVGANIGMLTIHAASLVGSSGRVDAVEPHPEGQARISRLKQDNCITQIELHSCGCSKTSGEAFLMKCMDILGHRASLVWKQAKQMYQPAIG
jgi:hypothetical protein